MANIQELTESIKVLKDEEKNQLLLEVISNSSVLWLNDFVKAFEEKFGVTAAMPVLAAGAGAGSATQEKAEEKTTFDAVLSSIGSNKIQAIKLVRTMTSLGLKEAKTLVDTVPQPVKTGIPKEEAEKIKKEFETVGAKVEIK